VGLTVGPLAMPALVWAALTVGLPVALVIFVLIAVAMSNCLSYITLRVCTLVEDRSNEASLRCLAARCGKGRNCSMLVSRKMAAPKTSTAVRSPNNEDVRIT
jgi:hypothetical protein